MTTGEYQQFLIAHLIVFDTINAKFLWKRIPKTVKDEGGSLKEISEITKCLSEK